MFFILDFSNYYGLVIQDEVQVFHWNKSQSTSHVIAVYLKNASSNKSVYYLIRLTHDVEFVFNVINIAIM